MMRYRNSYRAGFISMLRASITAGGYLGAVNSIKVLVIGLRSNVGEVDCALFGARSDFRAISSKAGKTTKQIERASGMHFADSRGRLRCRCSMTRIE